MTQVKNVYLQLFDHWIKELDELVVKNLSVRGSLDQGWIDIEFDINNYGVYILLNNDVIQIYDRQIHKKNEGKYLQATDALADFTPDKFKLDVENLFKHLQLSNVEEYFQQRNKG